MACHGSSVLGVVDRDGVRAASLVGMDITHLGHAAVLVESGGDRVLVDPGNFTDRWHDLTGLTAIFVTHQHPDHVDPEHLARLLQANPEASVHVEPAVVDIVAAAGGAAHALSAGDSISLNSVRVSAVGGQHAVIHVDIPRIGNVGLVIKADDGPTLFHPGDCLTEIPEGIDIVATPAYGPWAAMKETVDFVRAVGAPAGFLIHDGLLNERGWALVFGRLNAMTSTVFTDLREAGVTTF